MLICVNLKIVNLDEEDNKLLSNRVNISTTIKNFGKMTKTILMSNVQLPLKMELLFIPTQQLYL